MSERSYLFPGNQNSPDTAYDGIGRHCAAQRGKDVLGPETDDMLRDRIKRSREETARTRWVYDGIGLPEGALLPYEPRQGPVRLQGADLKWYLFEADLLALCEKHGTEIQAQYDGASVTFEGKEFYL